MLRFTSHGLTLSLHWLQYPFSSKKDGQRGRDTLAAAAKLQPKKRTVISTEAAHAFVSSGAKKSASLPKPSPSQHRALAVACSLRAKMTSNFAFVRGAAKSLIGFLCWRFRTQLVLRGRDEDSGCEQAVSC